MIVSGRKKFEALQKVECLTVSYATKFRLFETKRIGRRQFNV